MLICQVFHPTPFTTSPSPSTKIQDVLFVIRKQQQQQLTRHREFPIQPSDLPHTTAIAALGSSVEGPGRLPFSLFPLVSSDIIPITTTSD